MKRKFKFLVAGIVASAFALSGCGSSASTNSSGTASNSGSAAGEAVTANGTEPENPLLPGDTNETGGSKILDLVNAGLYYYDATGKPQPELAESVTTEDSQVYTVKVQKGHKFEDGTEIKAKNFVNAWNYIVKNSSKQNYFFENIKGFKLGSDLPGLELVDDYTFKVTLFDKEADWPLRLGYSAYYPLPDSALKDAKSMKAYGEKPVASGPYKVKKWTHNQDILLIPNPKYDGPRKAKNSGVKFKFYAQQDAAYNDLLSDNLDVLDAIPDSAFKTYMKTLGKRAVNQPAAIFQSFSIDVHLKHFAGEEGKLRRAALSMAINRPEITEKIFNKTRTPATDFTSPVIPGHSDSLKGEGVLKYNPEKAKELWKQADAISPWDGTFKLAYNADGGHQAWVDAVCNSVKNTLGIKAQGDAYPDFKSFRTKISKHQMTTAFRTGWQADYPSLFNFLGPIYAKGAPSNDSQYYDPKFDALLDQGQSSKTIAEANQYFTSAQDILVADLPAIPLWYANVNGGYSKNVSDVKFGWNSVPLYYNIVKK